MPSVEKSPTEVLLPPEHTPEPAVFELNVAEILASTRRLWVRGRVRVKSAATDPRWFGRWRGKPSVWAARAAVLESRISGLHAANEIDISPEGFFEAAISMALPPTRRGWRVARNQLTAGELTVEGCSVVLHPPAGCQQAIIVVLPERKEQDDIISALGQPDQGQRIGTYLQQQVRKADGPCPVYYLAGAAAGVDDSAQQLALTINALGWPTGTVIVLPKGTETHEEVILTGIDRLRWLFAGTLDLAVVNLDAELAEFLDGKLFAKEDRARISSIARGPNELPNSPPSAADGYIGMLRPTRSFRVTRYPLVFCHGLLAFSAMRMQIPDHLNYFRAIEPFIQERGFRALYPEVGATNSVAQRAGELCEQIQRWTDEPVNLIAHSMGGLDCRYMINHLGMADRVRSLTTIATPHRGTYLADWFLQNYRHRVPLLLALEMLGLNIDGFLDTRLDACREFNNNTPDVPAVRYFSYGAEVPHARVHPVLRRAWTLLTPIEGPNDGMVSSASAKWGECLGVIRADHFAQTPDAALLHPAGMFDSLSFYLQLAEDLARRGF